jgi:hypothetical protein
MSIGASVCPSPRPSPRKLGEGPKEKRTPHEAAPALRYTLSLSNG